MTKEKLITIRCFLTFLVCLVFSQETAASADTVLSLPFTSQEFRIDGKLDEDFYRDSAPLKLSSFPKGGELSQKTLAWLATDGELLYFAFQCFESETGQIRNDIKTRDGRVWYDDCVEVFLDTDFNKKNYCHFAVNSLGTQYDALAGEKSEFAGWNGDWKAGTFVGKEYWSAEIAVPMSQFLLREKFGLNLCRERKVPPQELGSLVILGDGSFHQPGKFAEVSLLPGSNGSFIKKISVREFRSGKDDSCSIEFENVDRNPQEFKMLFTLTDEKGAGRTYQTKNLFQPGEKKNLSAVYRTGDCEFLRYGLFLYKQDRLLYHEEAEIPHYFSVTLAGDTFLSREEIPVFLDCSLAGQSLQGFFFEILVGDGGNTRIIKRVEAARLRESRLLSAALPVLSPGAYFLKVRLADGSGNPIDTIRRNIEITGFGKRPAR
ncbi:MAG: hypothetical protein WC552_10020 [Candidatus Omnitrophota bacterium]